MALKSTRTILANYVRRINKGLRGLIGDRKPERLYGYVLYQLGLVDEEWKNLTKVKGGKRLRSAIPLLIARYLGDGNAVLDSAMAIELFHNFTLIIDDVQDGDEIRRGRPTLWKLIGVPQALNAALITESLSMEASRNACSHLSSRTSTKWMEGILSMSARVFEGQHMDILYEQEEQVYTAQYLQMASAKTAALFGLAFAQSFALHAHEKVRKLAPSMRKIGEAAGMAFQIQDDILGLWGDPSKTGKPACSDLKRRKKTLPIVHALENGSRGARKLILDAFSKEVDDKQAETILNCLEVTGSKDYALSQVRQYTGLALTQLSTISIEEECKSKLIQIIEELGKRSL